MRWKLAGGCEPAFGTPVVGCRRPAFQERSRAVYGETITADEHVAVHGARGRAAGADFPLEIEPDGDALPHLVGEVVDANPECFETEGPVLVGRLAHQFGPDAVAAQLETLARRRHLVVAHR